MVDRATNTLGLVGPSPPPAGGMATQTRQLHELLRAEGVCVDYVQTNAPYVPAWIGGVVGLRAVFRLLPYFFKLWRTAGRASVVHLMSNSGWAWQLFSAPALWLCWLRRTPVIVNYRGGEAAEYFARSFPRVGLSLNKASRVIVPSAYLQQIFAVYGINSFIIPNIINLDRFKPAPAKREQSTLKMVITRNLEALYGIPMALRAMEEVCHSIDNAELYIAGSGPQLAELEAQVAAMQLQEKVFFVGKLGPEEIVEFYQSADIMLNPTTVDNMPNSVLEAMACGVVVISTDVGGIPYIVEHEKNALLVSNDDSAGMAAAVVRVAVDHELRERLVEGGLAEVGQYSWPVVKSKWLDLYQSLGLTQ